MIDIVLPTYHPKLELLKHSINSILAQTFEDWILYVIDDGTANSTQILKLLPKKRSSNNLPPE